MSNRAALIRSEFPALTVTRRGQRFLEFSLGGGQRRFVSTIEPLHFGSGNDQEIETAWTPTTGAWQWQMTANSFNVFARSVLNAGDLVQWLDPASGQNVTLQPLGINWVDNVTDSRQQIAQPQAVAATANDCQLTWSNGYGPGRHFRYTTHPSQLQKEFILDSLAGLASPTVSNPYLEVEFILKRSAGTTLFVNGAAWDNATKMTTASRIEFRLGSGQTVWRFAAPSARDAAGNVCPGIFQLRRQGSTRYCTVRIPRTWLQSATFPVSIDPTLTTPQDATVKDTYLHAGSPTTNYGADQYDIKLGREGGDDCRPLMEFDLSSIPAGSTINSADLHIRIGYIDAFGNNLAYTLYELLREGWTEAGATWNTYDGSNVWGTAGAGSTSTDRQSTALGTFNSGATYPAWVTVSLNATAVAAWCGSSNSNHGFVIFQDTPTSYSKTSITPSDNSTAANRPYMVVDYTEGGGTVLEGAAALAGSSAISATARVIARASASLSGQSSLTPTARVTLRGAAVLAGQGNLTVAARLILQAAAALAGQSSLSATGHTGATGQVIQGAAVLSSQSSLAATARVLLRAAASLQDQSGLQAAGRRLALGSAVLQGQSTLQSAGRVTIRGAASMQGQSDLQAAGALVLQGQAILIAVSSLIASGALASKGPGNRSVYSIKMRGTGSVTPTSTQQVKERKTNGVG